MTRILVVGDSMLDVVCRGVVERLSPEAPVPVLKNPVEFHHLGGAANTAANARGLGADVTLVSSVGDDEDGRRVTELLRAAGVDAQVDRASGRTTRKTRFLADAHHLLRVDCEVASPEPTGIGATPRLLALVRECDALLVSDYRKGFIHPSLAATLIAEANRCSRPSIVDTKARRLEPFSGATVLTPNLSEARKATGEDDPLRAAAAIRDQTAASVVVTLGARGMLILSHEGTKSIPSQAIEVADVTGAGDTVAAAVAVGLAHGCSLVDAAGFASRAAAVAVAHAGTYAVDRQDVEGTRGIGGS